MHPYTGCVMTSARMFDASRISVCALHVIYACSFVCVVEPSMQPYTGVESHILFTHTHTHTHYGIFDASVRVLLLRLCCAHVAFWLLHSPCKRGVASSNLAIGLSHFVCVSLSIYIGTHYTKKTFLKFLMHASFEWSGLCRARHVIIRV